MLVKTKRLKLCRRGCGKGAKPGLLEPKSDITKLNYMRSQIEQREASEERAMFVKTERLRISGKGCEVAEPHRGTWSQTAISHLRSPVSGAKCHKSRSA